MKIKEGFILRKVGIQYIVAAVGEASEAFDGMIRLNETGAFLFRQLESGATEKELVDALMENYEVEEKTALEGVGDFLEHMREAEAIEG